MLYGEKESLAQRVYFAFPKQHPLTSETYHSCINGDVKSCILKLYTNCPIKKDRITFVVVFIITRIAKEGNLCYDLRQALGSNNTGFHQVFRKW